MTHDKLDPQRTAIIFFDMLNGHVKKDDPATKTRYAPVIAAATQVLQAARQHDMMITYASANHRADNATTAHTFRDTDFYRRDLDAKEAPSFIPLVAGGTWESQVIDELAPQEKDYLIPKYRWSSFFQTYLDLALRTRKIDTVVISGGSTEIGVASTAYAARDLDYNVVIVSDACTSPVQQAHDNFMQYVFPRLAWVRTAKEVVALLNKS